MSLMLSAAHASQHGDVSQLIRSGKLSEAMAQADQFLASNPKDLQMRFLKGVIQRDTGRVDEAIDTFVRLTEEYPEQPEPYNNVAVLYASQNRFDRAVVALEMAIRSNPNYATAHENLGDVYAKLASQAYAKSLQIDSSNPSVAPKLARLRDVFGASGVKSAKPAPLASASASAKPVPVITATPADAGTVKEVETAVQAWASAWAAKDVAAYLASYGADFVPPNKQGRSDWERERQQRIGSKSSISVQLANLSVAVNGNRAFARFRQDYKADKLEVSDRKTLELVKHGDQWQIVKESVGS